MFASSASSAASLARPASKIRRRASPVSATTFGEARGEPGRVDLRGLGRQHRREQLEQAQAQRADPVDELVGRAPAERRELREPQRMAQQRDLALGQEARLRREPARERDLPAPERPEFVEEDPRVHGALEASRITISESEQNKAVALELLFTEMKARTGAGVIDDRSHTEDARAQRRIRSPGP